MTLDDDVVRDVKDELTYDPRVDAAAIAVAAHDGRVTLRGTVGSLREKREAAKAAERVLGVVVVDNQLQVRLLSDERRNDAELRADVLQALMLDSQVPETVDVSVEHGFVTLTGTAKWQYERAEAELVTTNVPGAVDVLNDIDLEHAPTPDADVVQEAIRRAFKRNADLDADVLHVWTAPGEVTIEGTVRSWAEHDQALAAAWAARGVVSVHDRMKVVS